MREFFGSWRYWLAAAIVVAVGWLLWINIGDQRAPPKVTEFRALDGRQIRFIDERASWTTGQPDSYILRIPVAKVAPQSEIALLADEAFAQYAGARASDMGFGRVVIKPDDGSPPGGLNLFGLRIWLDVDVGVGPANLNPDMDRYVYVRGKDGAWSRDASVPPAPPQLRRFTLPSGAEFEWTGGYEDYPFGEFVFDCVSCTGSDDAQVVSQNYSALLRLAFVDLANADDLKKAEVSIFLGLRKSQWSFPTVLRIRLAKRADGEWVAPKTTPQQIRNFLDSYRAAMRKRGDNWRKKIERI